MPVFVFHQIYQRPDMAKQRAALLREPRWLLIVNGGNRCYLLVQWRNSVKHREWFTHKHTHIYTPPAATSSLLPGCS